MKKPFLTLLIVSLLAPAFAAAQDSPFDTVTVLEDSMRVIMTRGNMPETAPAPVSTLTAAAPVLEREWLVLVFISGVNDLGILGYAHKDLNEMEQVGSTGQVTVVAEYSVLSVEGADRDLQFQRGSKTLLMERDDDPDTVNSTEIHTSEDMDMGSWSHLARFARRAILKFPAKKVMLVLWNHGSGTLGIANDDVSGAKIGIKDLGRALNQIKLVRKGAKLDVFATDACLMQMAGVAYELKDHASVIVGSEEVISGPGYPYHTMLAALNDEPGMDAEEAGRALVARYGAAYPRSGSTLSALRASRLDGFVRRLDAWTSALMVDETAMAAAASDEVINDTFYFRMPDSKDLCDYIDAVSFKLPATSPALAAGDALKEYIKRDLVVAAASGAGTHRQEAWPYTGRTHGLAVYIPFRIYDSETYESLAFAAGSSWDDFLRALMRRRMN
ncbi:MAG TPA: clostripain-related cysteine peptidase [Elusimicrobiales bacterium]|nr:clostripain-related cysteine peptidase [Elusimicrobiales bacterium]